MRRLLGSSRLQRICMLKVLAETLTKKLQSCHLHDELALLFLRFWIRIDRDNIRATA